jgi:hypothetical protein
MIAIAFLFVRVLCDCFNSGWKLKSWYCSIRNPAMLSTIVFCEDKPASAPGRDLAEVLARTLASLVTAKVDVRLSELTVFDLRGVSMS